GTVSIWDHGTYDNLLEDKAPAKTMAEALEEGRLEFVLHGKKLRGKFALIRMKGRGERKPQWLLIKMKDEFAQPDGENNGSRPKAKASKRASGTRKTTARPPRNGVDVTHPDRLMFPEAGLIKGDIVAYYARIAERLLPFLKDRPVTLERLPDGLAGPDAPHFWQKDTPAYYPEWIPRVRLDTESGKPVEYAVV